MIIASGTKPDPLTRILAGEPAGTLFLAQRHARARKRWIGLTARPRGHYVVVAGARLALESGSKSLLAIGILEVVGEFEKGDVVSILTLRGLQLGEGVRSLSPPCDLSLHRPHLGSFEPISKLIRERHSPESSDTSAHPACFQK